MSLPGPPPPSSSCVVAKHLCTQTGSLFLSSPKPTKKQTRKSVSKHIFSQSSSKWPTPQRAKNTQLGHSRNDAITHLELQDLLDLVANEVAEIEVSHRGYLSGKSVRTVKRRVTLSHLEKWAFAPLLARCSVFLCKARLRREQQLISYPFGASVIATGHSLVVLILRKRYRYVQNVRTMSMTDWCADDEDDDDAGGHDVDNISALRDGYTHTTHSHATPHSHATLHSCENSPKSLSDSSDASAPWRTMSFLNVDTVDGVSVTYVYVSRYL